MHTSAFRFLVFYSVFRKDSRTNVINKIYYFVIVNFYRILKVSCFIYPPKLYFY